MKKGNLIKSTAIIMVVALISRAIGLVRDLLISYKFEAGVYVDAYKLAASIPDTIFTLVGLAISTSFLPMLSRIKVKNGDKEMHKFANNIINILLGISIVIFIVASFFPEQIVGILTDRHRANPDTILLATNLARITLLNLLFLSINACFTALLQVHEDFIIPSILGLFFNLPIVLYLLLFRDFNIYGLTIANVIGNFARVVVQVPSLKTHGYRFKFFINFKDERVRKILVLIIPVVIGAGANSLNMIVDKKIASGLGDGVITTLDNAQLLITFVNTMITTSISTVVYPVLANRVSEGKKEEFLEILTKSIIYLAILLIPISIGLVVYRENVVRIIFVKYTEDSLSLVSLAILGYSVGIFFTGVRDILNSTLFTMGKTKTTASNGIVGVIFNIIFSIILSKRFGILGVALASSIAMIITSMLLLRSIIKLQGKLDVKLLFEKLVKVIIATAVMTSGILLIGKFTIGFGNIIHLVIGAVLGIVIYFIAIYLLKIEEVTDLIGMVKNKANI